MLEDEHPIGALECVAQEIRGAFIDLQRRADERRVLAFDIGETNAQLVATMTAAGFTEQGARHPTCAHSPVATTDSLGRTDDRAS